MVGVGRGSHELGLERWARFQQLEGGKGVPGMGKGMSSWESVGHGLGGGGKSSKGALHTVSQNSHSFPNFS